MLSISLSFSLVIYNLQVLPSNVFFSSGGSYFISRGSIWIFFIFNVLFSWVSMNYFFSSLCYFSCLFGYFSSMDISHCKLNLLGSWMFVYSSNIYLHIFMVCYINYMCLPLFWDPLSLFVKKKSKLSF